MRRRPRAVSWGLRRLGRIAYGRLVKQSAPAALDCAAGAWAYSVGNDRIAYETRAGRSVLLDEVNRSRRPGGPIAGHGRALVDAERLDGDVELVRRLFENTYGGSEGGNHRGALI